MEKSDAHKILLVDSLVIYGLIMFLLFLGCKILLVVEFMYY